MKKLLLVEDDNNLSTPLIFFLNQNGFDVQIAPTLLAARTILKSETISLLILDWNLPDGEGIDLINEIKDKIIPIIILSSRNKLEDKVKGLDLGAIDYLTKPFEPRELLSRIKSQLRHQNTVINLKQNNFPEPFQTLQANGITMNFTSRTVSWNNHDLELTKKEFDLLKLFLENPDKVFSRDELLNIVWGYDQYPSTRTIDNHILKLRQLIAEHYFETVRGIGYRFKKTS